MRFPVPPGGGLVGADDGGGGIVASLHEIVDAVERASS